MIDEHTSNKIKYSSIEDEVEFLSRMQEIDKKYDKLSIVRLKIMIVTQAIIVSSFVFNIFFHQPIVYAILVLLALLLLLVANRLATYYILEKPSKSKTLSSSRNTLEQKKKEI